MSSRSWFFPLIGTKFIKRDALYKPMRIFRKTHFWQDKRTYLELDGEMPRINEKGFVEEGSLNIRIGDESGIRAAFKMDTDELRSMVDVITLFLKEHDAKMMRLYAEREERKAALRRLFSLERRMYGP